MNVSVVVCTYTLDRWNDIVLGLRALEGQTLRPTQVVLVVDHNPELLDELVRRTDDFRLRLEVVANTAARGLSGARNTGVAATIGDVIAFLDDDAIPNQTWLERLVEPFSDENVMISGGKAQPAWPAGTAPAWFPEEFQWVVGCSYRGQPKRVADVRNVIGASMAIRSKAFAAVGDFPDGVGRIGTLPVGCEETEFCIRTLREIPGARVVYQPESCVLHTVGPERVTPRYFVRRCLAEGRSKAQIAALVGGQAATSAERSYSARVLPVGVLRGFASVLRGDLGGPQRSMFILLGFACTAFGYVRGRVMAGPAQGR